MTPRRRGRRSQIDLAGYSLATTPSRVLLKHSNLTVVGIRSDEGVIVRIGGIIQGNFAGINVVSEECIREINAP